MKTFLCALSLIAAVFASSSSISFNDRAFDSIRFATSSSTFPKAGDLVAENSLNNETYYVCADGFDLYAADVACKQLGFGSAAAFTKTSFFDLIENGYEKRRGAKYHNDAFGHLTAWKCRGDEDDLSECRFDDERNPECDSFNLAGVVCQNQDQVVGLVNRVFEMADNEGALVASNAKGKLGFVAGISIETAEVACRQLGFGGVNVPIHKSFYGLELPRNVPKSLFSFSRPPLCKGNETTMSNCPTNSRAGFKTKKVSPAGVICKTAENRPEPIVRLVDNGRYNYQKGVVLIKSQLFPDRVVGICPNNFGLNETRIVCRSLGLDVDEPKFKTTERFSITLDDTRIDVTCNGDESDLSECDQRFNDDCSRSHYIKVDCNSASSIPMFSVLTLMSLQFIAGKNFVSLS